MWLRYPLLRAQEGIGAGDSGEATVAEPGVGWGLSPHALEAFLQRSPHLQGRDPVEGMCGCQPAPAPWPPAGPPPTPGRAPRLAVKNSSQRAASSSFRPSTGISVVTENNRKVVIFRFSRKLAEMS